jgi:NAD(P)-dependent dehydrogenase (short-subunit alcohol dehydrogenase family)
MASPSDKGELQDLVVVVTGAAGGLGAAVAQRAAEEGARVVLADIASDGVRTVAEGLRDQGLTAEACTIDVTSERQVDDLIAFAVTNYGRLDAIVNNAASMSAGPIHEVSSADFDRVMAVNVGGVFLGCRAAIRQFLRQESDGRIVNIASISGVVGLDGQPAYCASKGAVTMLTKQIALDYAAKGIRCNAVGPGSFSGDFLDGYLVSLADPARARDSILSAHPVGRLGAPLEVAEPVVFLLSDRASFITGALVMADGGYTAH